MSSMSSIPSFNDVNVTKHLIDHHKLSSPGKDTSPQVCSFDSFSLHFDLPLKAAAEKFGVRATAFKKRCRAIGIRHWPYRKVRSLKRSLQELSRCKDKGSLTEKQRYQYITYSKQLDQLMSPETYGIYTNRENNEEEEDNDNDNESSSSSTSSPKHEVNYMHDYDDKFPSGMSFLHRDHELPNPMLSETEHLPLPTPFRKNVSSTRKSPHPAPSETDAVNYNGISDSFNLFQTSQDSLHHSYSRGRSGGDEFNDALNQMEYVNEKHFLDDLFVELSPIYDCRV